MDELEYNAQVRHDLEYRIDNEIGKAILEGLPMEMIPEILNQLAQGWKDAQ